MLRIVTRLERSIEEGRLRVRALSISGIPATIEPKTYKRSQYVVGSSPVGKRR